jgi:hypothetical protein
MKRLPIKKFNSPFHFFQALQIKKLPENTDDSRTPITGGFFFRLSLSFSVSG